MLNVVAEFHVFLIVIRSVEMLSVAFFIVMLRIVMLSVAFS